MSSHNIFFFSTNKENFNIYFLVEKKAPYLEDRKHAFIDYLCTVLPYASCITFFFIH